MKDNTSEVKIKVNANPPSEHTIELGHFDQDGNGSLKPIEWIVLDEKDGKALLISKYALDCEPYNTELKEVTWEDCSLRQWLNGTFLMQAFSYEEQDRIAPSIITAEKNPVFDTNPGNDTRDKIFLLSITEAEEYGERAMQCQGTAYCYARGAWKDYRGNCNWWLRSPGDISECAAGVFEGGSVDCGGLYVNHDHRAVRPALWIKMK